jgi:hypothetical protein
MKIRLLLGRLLLLAAALWGLVAAGCGGDGQPLSPPVVLLHVGDRTVTVEAFKEILQTAKAAYTSSELEDPDMYEALCRRVLAETVEELILLQTAEELGVTVSEQDLERQVAAIRSAYPEGEFESMLMENAIPYQRWKSRLRTRLVMGRVIDLLVPPGLEVSREDVDAWLRSAPEAVRPTTVGEENGSAEYDRLVALVRQNKRCRLMEDWMRSARKRYAVSLNPVPWQRIRSREQPSGKAGAGMQTR